MKSSILYVTMVLSGLIALFACVTVEPQAEVNIDATVEARVAKEISETQPTSTPEVIATVVPNPEPTPTPKPTPEPTPIFESTPSSEEILSRANRTMNAIESMRYKVDMGMSMGAFDIPMTYEGEFHTPDNLRQTLSMNMMGLNIESDLMQVDGVAYEREFMEHDWYESYSFEGVDPREFWTGTESFLNFPIAVDPTIEDLYGVEVYKISWDIGQELGSSAERVLSILDFGDEDMPEAMVLEYWVDANSFHLRKLSIEMEMGDIEATEGEATEEEIMAMMLLGGGEIMGITMDFELFDFDQVDQIEAPSVAAPSPTATPAPTATPLPSPTPAPTGASVDQGIIYVGDTVGANLASMADTHYWNFEGIPGQRIFIEAADAAYGKVDPYIELFGPDEQNLLAENDDGPMAEVAWPRNALIDFEIIEAGIHSLVVRSHPYPWGEISGDYELSIYPVKDLGVLEIGTPVSENLSPAEKHYWHFDAVAGQIISIKAEADMDTRDTLDTYIELHGPSQHGSNDMLQANDDDWPDNVSYPTDSFLSIEILETASYTVMVSPAGHGVGSVSSQGAYLLSVQELSE
tara:strand:+ start:3193 stop:4923 length:1731 start_codon:yes stop_codon:yes gene_type:complete